MQYREARRRSRRCEGIRWLWRASPRRTGTCGSGGVCPLRIGTGTFRAHYCTCEEPNRIESETLKYIRNTVVLVWAVIIRLGGQREVLGNAREQLRKRRPDVRVGRAEQLRDELQLLRLAPAGQQRPVQQQFACSIIFYTVQSANLKAEVKLKSRDEVEGRC